MTIEYFHASKFGNGARIAEEFKRLMATRDVTVNVHHMKDIKPFSVPPADLYVFSSPARIGRPLQSVRRFLHGLDLPAGSKYALLTTQVGTQPDKKGQLPSAEEVARWQRIIPIMSKILQEKGLTQVAAEVIYVADIRGPLEEDWQQNVAAFAERLLD